MIPLTPPQSKALKFIRSFSLEHGYSPTYSEIAHGVGAKHKSRVHYIVKQLEERGAVRVLPNRKRAIEIVTPGLDFLAGDLRREVDKIAAREGVDPRVTVSEIVRSYLGMSA